MKIKLWTQEIDQKCYQRKKKPKYKTIKLAVTLQKFIFVEDQLRMIKYFFKPKR